MVGNKAGTSVDGEVRYLNVVARRVCHMKNPEAGQWGLCMQVAWKVWGSWHAARPERAAGPDHSRGQGQLRGFCAGEVHAPVRGQGLSKVPLGGHRGGY